MNLEDLTKHQIVLLTLLVSFVTSIATGIVTVSLMDQAPPAVTKTVNRIVQHTVERVVPTDLGETQQEAAVVESVVEKIAFTDGSQSLADAVATVSDGIVRVYTNSGAFAGYGSVLSADGHIIIPEDVEVRTASAVSLTGDTYNLYKKNDNVYMKSPVEGELIAPLQSASVSDLEVGTTVYTLSRGQNLTLRKGNLLGTESLESGVVRILTDITVATQGVPLFAQDGKVIGVSSKTGENYSFLPIASFVESTE